VKLESFNRGLAVIILVFLGLGWLSPWTLANVDVMWFPFLFIIVAWVWSAYFKAMVHRGGFPIVWPGGHSASAYGGVAREVPARDGYPRMVLIPLEGGNFMYFTPPGGKKHGWLIAPKSLVQVVDKAVFAAIKPHYCMPDELPPHLYEALKNEALYHPHGPIVWGMTAITDSSYTGKGMNMRELEETLEASNQTVNKLLEALKRSNNIIDIQSRTMAKFGIRFEESERESVGEKLSEALGVKDDD